ncbi:MAG TPA: MarR family transcriptional regulator [Actinocrinis sp.]|nr:MarR family transcriptional regulator [Actinocrinis sp.]
MHDSQTPGAPGSGLHAEVASDGTGEVVDALLTASRHLVAMAARSVAAVAENLTLPQYRMLVVLDTQGPRSLARLAQALEVNSSTAMRMVDRLAVAGMAEKVPSPDSRREVVLRLTPAGHGVVQKVTEHRVGAITRTVQAIPPDQRDHLITALRAFTDAGGEPTSDLPNLPGWA